MTLNPLLNLNLLNLINRLKIATSEVLSRFAILCPAFSYPAFSCPAILMVRHFHVRHF